MRVEGKETVLSDVELILFPNTFWAFCKILLQGKTVLTFQLDGVLMEIATFLPFMIYRTKTPLVYGLKRMSVLFYGVDIRSKIQIDNSESIPVWEGLRLLYNRMIESIPALIGDELTAKENYLLLKNYIAIADAYLILNAQFSNDYREKLDRCSQLNIESDLQAKIKNALEAKITGNIDTIFTSSFIKEVLIKDMLNTITILRDRLRVKPPYPRPLNLLFQATDLLKRRRFAIKKIIFPDALYIPLKITEILSNSVLKSRPLSLIEKKRMDELYSAYIKAVQVVS